MRARSANSGMSQSTSLTPSAASSRHASSNAFATVSSMPSKASVRGIHRRLPASGAAPGREGASPAMIASSSAQQATLCASGPIESRLTASGTTPSIGTRLAVGLNPVSPHRAEGMRTEPPVSVPIAAAAMPSVTETAAPEDEPPGIRPTVRSQGLRGVP